MPVRTCLLHGCLDASPCFPYRGAPSAHAEAQRLAAALAEARLAFRAATAAGDFGAAIAAELAWCAGEAELRRVLAELRHPKLRPFTPDEVEAAALGIRHRADWRFDPPPPEDDEGMDDEDFEWEGGEDADP